MVRQRLYEATPQYLQTASAQIMQTLETLPEFQQAQCILLYWSLPQEVATHHFVEKWYLHKQIVLPVMHGDGLLLRPFTGRENLVQRQFGVWEPITTTTIAETQTTPSTSEPIHTYEHPEEQSQSCSPCISSDQEPSYNPDLIILDGPIVRNYPSLVAGKMTAAIDRYLRMPEIRITTLEGRAPLIGAAAAAFRITNE